MRRTAALAAAGSLALAAGACPLTAADGATLQGEGVQAAWAVEGDAPLRVGQSFVLRVRTCPDDAVLQRVDATMPAHRHGMNYRPRIEPVGPGRWRVEGLLWHMAGTWELQFDLHVGERTQTLRQAVEFP